MSSGGVVSPSGYRDQSEVYECERSSCTSCCPSTGWPRPRMASSRTWTGPWVGRPRCCDRNPGRGHSRPPQLHRVGTVLAGQQGRALRDIHQRGHEACRDINAPRPGLDQRDGDRRRSRRIHSGPEAATRRRDRHHASISVAQALLAADVADELRLVIAPTIAGQGRRLFDGLPAIRLESIRSETSPTGSLLVDYRVVR